MAFREDKFEDNVPGKFYVDSTCIFCNVCIQAAPNNFAVSKHGAHDYVYKQPETDEELDEIELEENEEFLELESPSNKIH